MSPRFGFAFAGGSFVALYAIVAGVDVVWFLVGMVTVLAWTEAGFCWWQYRDYVRRGFYV